MTPILAAIIAGTCTTAAPEICQQAALIEATPCQWEDSANCFWNAQATGNGTGTSFVDIDGTAYTIPQATADRLTTATAARRPQLPAEPTDAALAAYVWQVVDWYDPSLFFAMSLHRVAAALDLVEEITDEAAAHWQTLDAPARLAVIECFAAHPFLSLSDAAHGDC